MIMNKKKNPVFVIGHRRSGTTMLVRLIRKYFEINFGPETQFIVRYYKKLSKYGDLEKEKNFYRLAKEISEERFFERAKRNFDFTFNLDKIMNPDIERTYSSLLSNMFEQFSNQQEMMRWGDKTPAYHLDLPIIDKLFPEAQYVHILRDGRDVALSQRYTHFGPKNVYCAAKEWVTAVEKISDFSKTLERTKFIAFKYEDILTDPEKIMIQLIQFLSIDDKDGKVTKQIKRNIHDDVRKGNFFKWKDQFSKKEMLIFEKVAHSVLVENDYPVQYDSPGVIGKPEKLFWEIDNFIKRNTRMDTLKDNVYKAQLRTKQLINNFTRKD